MLAMIALLVLLALGMATFLLPGNGDGMATFFRFKLPMEPVLELAFIRVSFK